MKDILRTSEFWMAVVAGAGQIAVSLGWIDQDSWNNVLVPALTYVVARVSGKAAKTVIK